MASSRRSRFAIAASCNCARSRFSRMQLELLAELLETLSADPPEVAQLEVDHRIGRRQRVRQEALEAFELLLGPNDCALLLLELVEQLEPLTAQRLELALHAGAIPIELEELLVGVAVLSLDKRCQHAKCPDSVIRGQPRI